ncbi:hypothetical protein Mapa_004929 [Marchantia paleacea]|nr:hypothetical protein Mapa_004929 [Marchantia paleacea]
MRSKPRDRLQSSAQDLSDGDSSPQSTSILLFVVNVDRFALGIDFLQACQLLPQHLVSRPVVVVSWVNLRAGVIGFLIDNNVAPPLRVVDSQSDQEEVALRVLKAQHAGRSAAVHLQDLLAILLAPYSATFVVPGALFHDIVPSKGLVLDHSHVDGEGHVDSFRYGVKQKQLRLCGNGLTAGRSLTPTYV